MSASVSSETPPDPTVLTDAEALLRDPRLVARFHEDLSADGLVGEKSASLALLLAIVFVPGESEHGFRSKLNTDSGAT
jgi:hypothetical protein